MCYGWATEQEQAYEVIQYKWYNSQEPKVKISVTKISDTPVQWKCVPLISFMHNSKSPLSVCPLIIVKKLFNLQYDL